MKFCKDCKYFKLGNDVPAHLGRCLHPDCASEGDSYFADGKKNADFAVLARKYTPCGVDAKLFVGKLDIEVQPKPPEPSFYERLFRFLGTKDGVI